MPTVDDFVLSSYLSMDDDLVVGVEADGDHVRISRASDRPVRFGVVKQRDVTAWDIAHLFDGDLDFVVNIPKIGIFQQDAIELCESAKVAWGGLADSMRALRLYDDPQMFFPPALSFVWDGLKRHTRVDSVSFVDSRRLLVTRKGGLPPLVLYIEPGYQAEVTSVRFALDRCSPFDIFVATNPNAGPTRQAVTAALGAGVEILRWADTLGRLWR